MNKSDMLYAIAQMFQSAHEEDKFDLMDCRRETQIAREAFSGGIPLGVQMAIQSHPIDPKFEIIARALEGNDADGDDNWPEADETNGWIRHAKLTVRLNGHDLLTVLETKCPTSRQYEAEAPDLDLKALNRVAMVLQAHLSGMHAIRAAANEAHRKESRALSAQIAQREAVAAAAARDRAAMLSNMVLSA